MKYWIFICCLFLFFGTVQSKEVKNPDHPIKGEWSFSPRKAWETDSAGKDILVEIRGIRIDEQGNVFVLNSKFNKVHLFNPQGKYLYSFAKKGEGPGEIKESFDLFLNDNLVIIPDMNKIHYFSREGKYQKSITVPEMFIPYLFPEKHQVMAIPFSSFRKEQRDVLLYDLKSKEKKEMFQIPKVRALRYSGKEMRLMLRMPFEVAEELVMVKSSGEIWYGYNNAYRIQRLDFTKKEQASFTIEGRQREKISQSRKLKLLEKVMEMQREIPKNILNTVANQIPDEIPYFHHLFADKSGLIYVLTATSKHPHKRNV
ncbi:MAG: 6-bladed beta-propeller, partial [Candidatus Aminicenantes bacterium]|nr:6-bladed beta-propeller [Candidatus Aminicenantes bacterium]